MENFLKVTSTGIEKVDFESRFSDQEKKMWWIIPHDTVVLLKLDSVG